MAWNCPSLQPHHIFQINSSKFREDFELTVIGDCNLQIERHVAHLWFTFIDQHQISDLVDWLVAKKSGVWDEIMLMVQRQLEKVCT